jgi:hypothetical protein
LTVLPGPNKNGWSQALESGNATIAIPINSKKHPDLIDVPNAVDLMRRATLSRDLIRMGPEWIATPSPHGSSIHDTLPVFTGALQAAQKDPEARREGVSGFGSRVSG